MGDARRVSVTQEVREIAKMAGGVSHRTVWRMLRKDKGLPDDCTTIRVRRTDAEALRMLAGDDMSMADTVSALVAAYRQQGSLSIQRRKKSGP